MCIRDSYCGDDSLSMATTIEIASKCEIPVSYTHLDVYKRQTIDTRVTLAHIPHTETFIVPRYLNAV